jgi:hypothetical protein
MTIAIYDGKSIAADRQITVNGKVQGYECKFEKWSKGVFVLAGKGLHVPLFKKFLETGKPFDANKSTFHVIYTKKKQVWGCDDDFQPFRLENLAPWGIGNAGSDAEVLCKIGFTAEDAARKVCEFDIFCSGPIDVVHIN